MHCKSQISEWKQINWGYRGSPLSPGGTYQLCHKNYDDVTYEDEKSKGLLCLRRLRGRTQASVGSGSKM